MACKYMILNVLSNSCITLDHRADTRKLNITSDNLVSFALETIVNTYVLDKLDATRQKAGFNYR